MPGKITELAALTGAGAAATDLLEAVDISDTAMAATGTNKKMTLAELIVFLQANGLGAVSGAGGVYPFMYQTSTAETITGNAFRTNGAPLATATRLWISETTTDGLNVAVGLGRIKAGFQVYVQDYADSTKFALFNVTADATDKGNYWEVTVAPVSSGGTFAAGKIALQSLSAAQSSKLFSTTTTAPGLAPGSNNAGPTNYLDATGAWSAPAGGGAAPIGTKMSALAALTGAGAAVGDILEVVDVSDTSMAASGTNKKITLAEFVIWTSANFGNATINGAKLVNDSVANLQLAPMPTVTLKGNITGGTAGPTDISQYDARGLLRRPIIANTSTAFAPVTATHENVMVTLSNASPVVVTLPSDGTSNFAIGAEIDFLWLGVGSCSFAQGGGATIVSAATVVAAPVMRIRYAAATAKKIAASTWLVVGDLA